MKSSSPLFAVLPLLALPSAAADPAEGFTSVPLHQPGAPTIELSSGDLLVYDGSTVDRLDASGVFVETVFALPGSFFAGCFALNASETVALVGESSDGGLFAVDLAAKSGTPLGNVALNYDAAFENEVEAVVSAATCGFGCGSDLIRIDVTDGAQTPLAVLPGASGPVAIAADGDLLYATSEGVGASSLLRFDASLLTGERELDESDADVVAGGLTGGTSMAYDAATGRAYLAANTFGSDQNRLLSIDASTGATATLLGPTSDWISGLQLLPGGGPGVFAPFQPGETGRLVHTATDFGTLDDRLGIDPARAELVLSGPGTGGGAGRVALDVSGGPAGGFAVLAACPLGDLAPEESAYLVGGLPLVLTALSPLTAVVEPVPLALDGAGAGSAAFLNDGGLVDVFAIQGFLVDAGAAALVATTTTATL